MGKHKIKRPAVFLDRDGTLIKFFNDIVRPSQVQILKYAPEALRLFREMGFRVVVITNQPVIDKGFIDRRGVDRLHADMNRRLKGQSAAIDSFYVCPHRHWDDCSCRKPRIGSIKKAVKKYHIDIKKSFFIGDTMRDVMTGRNANLKTVLVMTGRKGDDRAAFKVKPDYTVKNILAAAKLIKKIKKI